MEKLIFDDGREQEVEIRVAEVTEAGDSVVEYYYEVVSNERPKKPETKSVEINLTASDPDGFDKLLESRRGQIVNMLKQKENEMWRTYTVNSPWDGYLRTFSEASKQDDNIMYEFNTSSSAAIDFSEIAAELSRDNPICKVEFKGENGEREYYVVVHDSLLDKADVLNLNPPTTVSVLTSHAELSHPRQYKDWVEWARKVKNATWPGKRGSVTVTKIEV